MKTLSKITLLLAFASFLFASCAEPTENVASNISVDIYYVPITGFWDTNAAGDIKYKDVSVPGLVDSIVTGPYVICSQVEANGWRDLPYYEINGNNKEHLQFSYTNDGFAGGQLYALSTGGTVSIQNDVTALKVAIIKGGNFSGKSEIRLSDIIQHQSEYHITYHY